MHKIRVTAAAVAAVRQVAAESGQQLESLSLLVGTNQRGRLTLDVTDDLGFRDDPNCTLTVVCGLTIVVPLDLVASFSGTVIDVLDGAFLLSKPEHPAASASDPAQAMLSLDRLFKLSPRLRGQSETIDEIEYLLWHGDSRAAIVVDVDPLIVAAYTDELCAVALLQFPRRIAADYSLTRGHRLLTANSYRHGTRLARDLVRGERSFDRYCNFAPLIVDFLSDDHDRIEERKRQIVEDEWQSCIGLCENAMKRARGRYRDGCPPNSERPAF